MKVIFSRNLMIGFSHIILNVVWEVYQSEFDLKRGGELWYTFLCDESRND